MSEPTPEFLAEASRLQQQIADGIAAQLQKWLLANPGMKVGPEAVAAIKAELMGMEIELIEADGQSVSISLVEAFNWDAWVRSVSP